MPRIARIKHEFRSRLMLHKSLLFFLLLCSSVVSAEEIVFEMSVFGFTFGKMVVTKTRENDSAEINTLNAKGKTNFPWMKRKDETIIDVRYRHGKLLSSSYVQIKTGMTKH